MGHFNIDLAGSPSRQQADEWVAGDQKHRAVGVRVSVGRPVWPFLVASKRASASPDAQPAPNGEPGFSS